MGECEHCDGLVGGGDYITFENHELCCDQASSQRYLQGQRDMLAKTVRQLRRDSDVMLRFASECMDSGRFVAEMAAKRLREQAVDLLAAVKP